MNLDLEHLIRKTVTRLAIVQTGPRLRYLLQLKDWIDSGLPGAIVVAQSRFGKTFGTRWVLRTLEDIPYAFIPMRSRTKPSEGGFFSHILSQVRHRSPSKGNVEARRDRVTKYFVALAKNSKRNTIIICFDEAHKISEEQYQWMLELQNELDEFEVAVFYLLVGQLKLRKKQKQLEAAGMIEITSRFMMDEWRLPGLANLEEARECLEDYAKVDVNGALLGEVVSPIAFKRGWDIQMLAQPLWGEFLRFYEQAKPQQRKAFGQEVPMHYFVHAVANLLVAICQDTKFDGEVSSLIVTRAVLATKYDRVFLVSAGGESVEDLCE